VQGPVKEDKEERRKKKEEEKGRAKREKEDEKERLRQLKEEEKEKAKREKEEEKEQARKAAEAEKERARAEKQVQREEKQAQADREREAKEKEKADKKVPAGFGSVKEIEKSKLLFTVRAKPLAKLPDKWKWGPSVLPASGKTRYPEICLGRTRHYLILPVKHKLQGMYDIDMPYSSKKDLL
jgi:hypothetical protein